MKISDLKVNEGNVELEAVVKEVEEEPKVFQKFGKELKLQNIVVEDDSGTVKVTLWNEDTGKFAVGDKVKISNGYVKEFQDEKQLTSGKFGSIEKVGDGDASISTDSSSTAEEPEEAAGIPDSSNPAVEEAEVKQAEEEGLI